MKKLRATLGFLVMCTSAAAAMDLNIKDFGATGDGKTLDSPAITKAIAACSAKGGGVVVVPAGEYLCGGFALLSHVHLNLQPGSVLLASQNPSDYPLVEFAWLPTDQIISSLIYAHDAQDIGVCGSGTIDGQGASWWAPLLAAKAKKKAASVPAATRPSGTDLPDAGVTALPHGRPQLIRFLRCIDVVIDGVTLLNSPEWNIHPLFCERVRVDGVTIRAADPSPNTDGINPESCRQVQISNCRIDNGDDCITLKSGINEAGRKMARPDEDITITNCITQHGHGGITIGSEMSGGVRNVVVSNCVFQGTDNGIRFKSQRGRGGVVENIAINNLVMQNVPNPIIITSFYMGKDKPADTYPIDEGTPRMRNISISNLSAVGCKNAGAITGLRELPISDITLSNVRIESQSGFTCTDATDIRFLDCVFRVAQGKALNLIGCRNIDSSRVTASVSTTAPSN